MNRRGMTIIDSLLGVSASASILLGFASLVGQLHSASINGFTRAKMQESINAATEHVLQIGRLATSCKKTTDSTLGKAVLECSVDVNGTGIPGSFSNSRFEIITTPTGENQLVFSKRSGNSATEAWVQAITYPYASGFEICSSTDIQLALTSPADPNAIPFCGTVAYPETPSDRFFRFNLAFKTRRYGSAGVFGTDTISRVQSSFFVRNGGFGNAPYQWNTWDRKN